MKRISAVLLCVCLVLSSVGFGESWDYGTLQDGLSVKDALVIAASCCEAEGAAYDASSIEISDGIATAQCGSFTLYIETKNGRAHSVTIGAAELDADSAMTMGTIFGEIVALMGGFTDPNVVLSGIDFTAMDASAASSQSMVQDGYSISLYVDPEDAERYALCLSLTDSEGGAEFDTDPAEAILLAMDMELSASVVYTEETDPNGTISSGEGYIAKANFALQSLAPDRRAEEGIDVEDGGSIEVFSTPQEAYERLSYVETTMLDYFGAAEYALVWGSALLRLSPELTGVEVGGLVARFINAVGE